MSITKDKGITLIALVLTIVLLLLLAGVTINVALDGGLIQTTNKTAFQTEVSGIKQKLEEKKSEKISLNGGREPQEYEIAMENLDIIEEIRIKYGNKLVISNNGILYYYPDIVTDEKEKKWLEEIEVYAYTEQPVIPGTTLVQLYKNGELKIGDYVEYKPSETTPYDPDKGEGAGKHTGYTTFKQAIGQENLQWRVLKCDGKNVYLISDVPTVNELIFYGHIGYLNYKQVLNDTCNALYGNPEIGEGRSITLKDADEYVATLEKPPIAIKVPCSTDIQVENIYRPEQWEPVYTGLISADQMYTYFGGDPGELGLVPWTSNQWYANTYQHISIAGEVFENTLICWMLSGYDGAKGLDGERVKFNHICYSDGRETALSNSIRPIIKLKESVTDKQVPIIK